MPSGSRLFFPIVMAWYDNVGLDPPLTVPQLYEAAADLLDPLTELHASIDGQPVQGMFSYRVRSDPFSYTVPATDNILDLFGYSPFLAPYACPAGFCIDPAVVDGFWLLLTPLPPGTHTINTGGTFGPSTFSATINITVVPRGHHPGCT